MEKRILRVSVKSCFSCNDVETVIIIYNRISFWALLLFIYPQQQQLILPRERPMIARSVVEGK